MSKVRLSALRAGEKLICRRCVEEASEDTATDADTSVISADDLVDAYRLTDIELTSEQEYAEDLDNEQEWHLLGDGTLSRGPRNPWSGDRGAAWGLGAAGTIRSRGNGDLPTSDSEILPQDGAAWCRPVPLSCADTWGGFPAIGTSLGYFR